MRNKKCAGIALCLIAAMFFAGCGPSEPASPPSSPVQESPPPTQTPAGQAPGETPEPAPPCHVSAWAAYWDTEDVLSELAQYEDLEALCYFEAYFDSEAQFVVPQELTTLRQSVHAQFPNAGWKDYLTFVNDQADATGKFSLKDTDLLWSLLGDEAAMLGHVENVVALAKSEGFDGIEIDYERIRKDLQLWEKFFAFCEALYVRASEEGLALRVLLEPNTPFESLTFPQGPDYVMMCYNLYGGHSGPGPKADAAFIRGLLEKMSTLPGRKDFAIATGGFDWCGDTVKSLTEADALALAEEISVAEQWRGEESHAKAFRYTDDEGGEHEVWYADQTTLAAWAELIREEGGGGISLWRLGGNLGALE